MLSCSAATACIANYHKYGVLICIRCHDYRRQDIILGAILYALIPCHLFVAYIIELAAAQQAKGAVGRRKRSDAGLKDSEKDSDRNAERREFQSTWRNIALAHTVNATLCLSITTVVVYNYIYHPLIGTLCELHAVIVWLKNCSYAFTNRDLRHALIHPEAGSSIPDIYSACPYPRNISLSNLTYFWWAPTLVYQPVYPRSTHIRWTFVLKRMAEFAGLSVFIWLASAQYAAPVLRNSLDKIATLNIASIVERLMKLSTISSIIWLAGFFALFQSFLNALAEITRFGDREFYTDWWNSPSVGAYWRTWNKPVYHFMKRHIYSPLMGRGWSSHAGSAVVFVFSGVLHELLVGVPTHNIIGQSLTWPFDPRCYLSDRQYIGVAFIGMIVQLPLIAVTLPLEKMQGINSKIVGNCIFWVSFCLVGQPLAALLYFFAWQAKYGSVSKAQN